MGIIKDNNRNNKNDANNKNSKNIDSTKIMAKHQ